MKRDNEEISQKDCEIIGTLVWQVFESWKKELHDVDLTLLHRAFEHFQVDREHFPTLAHFLAKAIHPTTKPRNDFELASRNLELFLIKLGMRSPRKASSANFWMPTRRQIERRMASSDKEA